MSTLLDQFRGEQTHDTIKHPGPLTWPGANGLPIVGAVSPLLKQHEVDNLPVRTVVNCRDFDLGDPKEQAAYLDVLNRCKMGWFQCLSRTQPARDPVTGHIRIYMEWIQRYSVDPKAQGSSSHGNEAGQSQ